MTLQATPTTRATPAHHGEGQLAAEAVTFRYPHFELGPLSLEARSGQLTAIIGPNGSGKSTLLELASGYLRPLRGRVLLEGKDLHALPPPRRGRLIGLARQDTPLLFPFTVREFVRQGRHPHLGRRLFENSEDELWVEWAIERTSLSHLASRRVNEISGGEFQRAVLARTLAQRPRLLLLDEPTANLDIGYQIEMLALLRHLAATEPFIVIMVTHELNLAAEMADTILLLEGGRAVLQGPPEAVLNADLLSRAFRTPVAVDCNPSSGRPRVTWMTTASGRA
jgi:ABC-type cobalamin/Fe3+-siderophores transport system ATPase subunit